MSCGGTALKPLPEELRLAEFLNRTGRLAIAFSGGCDSTLLAGFAARELGAERVLLVHVNTPLTFRREDDSAREFADRYGLAYSELKIDALNDPEIVRNDKWRCFHCKNVFLRRFLPRRRNADFICLRMERIPMIKTTGVRGREPRMNSAFCILSPCAGSANAGFVCFPAGWGFRRGICLPRRVWLRASRPALR